MDPKKWLYNAHRFVSPSPRAMKWIAPLATAPLAYYGHKLGAKTLGKGLKSVGLERAGKEVEKSNPLMFTAAMTALSTALSQGLYQPDPRHDKDQMKDWKKWFYKDAMEKSAAFGDNDMLQAAAIQQGWGDDPLMKQKVNAHRWMVPSVDSRLLKENIYDTPGFTAGQKTFLRDSVDGAAQVAGDPIVSMNDLGIGAEKAIVHNAHKVPGMWDIASRAVPRMLEAAFIGRGIGTLMGGTPATVQTFQNAGLVTGVLNTSGVMQKFKSIF